ncbi:MAG TPA: serine/threonine-protein kinase, partial [Nannocystis sp.]
MPLSRDSIHSSASAEPTLLATPPGLTPGARRVDPTAPTLTPHADTRGDANPQRTDDAPAPASIGRFTVLRELGRGGTGVVYAAYDEQLDRKVAVKLLHSETREDVARVRLMREAQAMARLSHPNIVGVHEVGTFGRQVYVAMEFVHGMTLHAWLKRRRRDFHEIVALFRQAGEGLAAAHDAGLVHRDFKPANVMVGDDGRVRVLDYGLARAEVSPVAAPGLEDLEPAEEHTSALANLRSLVASITLTGRMLGTPAYMAPEQFLGTRVDARSDQFAFCVALFEAAFRSRPFPGDTLAELMASVLAGVVSEPCAPVGVPRALRPLLLRGLQREPAARWPAMRPLLAALAPMARAPVRRSWFAGAGVAAALAWSGVALATRGAFVDPVCTGGQEQIEAVWSPEVHARIEQGIDDSGLEQASAVWLRVEDGLDRYSEDWLVGYADACGETGEILDLRMACLGERHRALATAIRMFEDVDAELLAHADRLIADLPPIDVCGDEKYLRAKVRPPADPDVKARVDALRKDLQDAQTLESGGQLSEALKALETAIAAAPADYPPLRAELAYTQGTILENLGRYEEARTAFETAFFAAVESGHHEYTIDAANRLAYVIGRRLSDRRTARDWLAHAETYAQREGDPLRRGRVATTAGALLNSAAAMGADTRAEARVAFDQARRAFAEARAEDTIDYARYLRFYGDFLASINDPEAAIRAHEASLKWMSDALGKQHPDVAMVHNSLGISLSAAKKHEAALKTLREGLDAAVDLPNQRNHVYMTLYFNSAEAYQELGRLPEAEAAMRAGLAVLERSSGSYLRETHVLQYILAGIIAKAGRPGDAEALLREALARGEATWGPNEPILVDAMATLADLRRQA